jgi:outer membrane usher protein
MSGLWACTFALFAIILPVSNAWGQDERGIALEVILNGHSTGQVGEFLDRKGVLYARPSELRDLGLAVPPSANDEPIPLSSLPDISVQINEARQTLLVSAGDAALMPTELAERSSSYLAPLTPSSLGAVLNYDVLGTFNGRQITGGALLDARLFGRFGLVQTTGLVNFTPYDGQKTFVRLDTTYTFSEPGKMRRWRVGDVVTGALSWSRAVRLGGIQVASDFTLRPDLITYPLPVVSASAAVPSTVDVMVNGIRQFSQPVQPGPFTVRNLPVVTGAGDVAVVVQNAVGRQTLLILPFYASTALLTPGLASYSMEAGLVRKQYGQTAGRYSGRAANGSLRYGVSDWLTLEVHGEVAGGLTLLGGGAALRLGTLGILDGAVSASRGHGATSLLTSDPARNGRFISLGFQRLSRDLNLSVHATLASRGYRDLAAVNGAPVPRFTLNTSVGRQLGPYGAVSLAYIKQTFGRTASDELSSDREGASFRSDLVTLSYNVPVARRFSVYATGFKDMRRAPGYGTRLGINLLFGGLTSVSAEASLNDGRASTTLAVARPALKPGDFGYRIQDTEGSEAHRVAEGEYLTGWGRLTAGVDQASGLLTGRAGTRGALILFGGRAFTSSEIYDSFAVVRTGDVAGVPVLYENRPIGVTNSRGELLVPSLLSYQNNKLAVDLTRLPPDVEVGQTKMLVRPSDRVGIAVDFQVRLVRAALLTLRDVHGSPIPIGSVVRIEGASDRPVGYDGQVYVTGLIAANRLNVVLPAGSVCTASFDYVPVKDDIPVIGPVTCK